MSMVILLDFDWYFVLSKIFLPLVILKNWNMTILFTYIFIVSQMSIGFEIIEKIKQAKILLIINF